MMGVVGNNDGQLPNRALEETTEESEDIQSEQPPFMASKNSLWDNSLQDPFDDLDDYIEPPSNILEHPPPIATTSTITLTSGAPRRVIPSSAVWKRDASGEQDGKPKWKLVDSNDSSSLEDIIFQPVNDSFLKKVPSAGPSSSSTVSTAPPVLTSTALNTSFSFGWPNSSDMPHHGERPLAKGMTSFSFLENDTSLTPHSKLRNLSKMAEDALFGNPSVAKHAVRVPSKLAFAESHDVSGLIDCEHSVTKNQAARAADISETSPHSRLPIAKSREAVNLDSSNIFANASESFLVDITMDRKMLTSETLPATSSKPRNITPQHLLKELSRISPLNKDTLPEPPSNPAFHEKLMDQKPPLPISPFSQLDHPKSGSPSTSFHFSDLQQSPSDRVANLQMRRPDLFMASPPRTLAPPVLTKPLVSPDAFKKFLQPTDGEAGLFDSSVRGSGTLPKLGDASTKLADSTVAMEDPFTDDVVAMKPPMVPSPRRDSPRKLAESPKVEATVSALKSQAKITSTSTLHPIESTSIHSIAVQRSKSSLAHASLESLIPQPVLASVGRSKSSGSILMEEKMGPLPVRDVDISRNLARVSADVKMVDMPSSLPVPEKSVSFRSPKRSGGNAKVSPARLSPSANVAWKEESPAKDLSPRERKARVSPPRHVPQPLKEFVSPAVPQPSHIPVPSSATKSGSSTPAGVISEKADVEPVSTHGNSPLGALLVPITPKKDDDVKMASGEPEAVEDDAGETSVVIQRGNSSFNWSPRTKSTSPLGSRSHPFFSSTMSHVVVRKDRAGLSTVPEDDVDLSILRGGRVGSLSSSSGLATPIGELLENVVNESDMGLDCSAIGRVEIDVDDVEVEECEEEVGGVGGVTETVQVGKVGEEEEVVVDDFVEDLQRQGDPEPVTKAPLSFFGGRNGGLFSFFGKSATDIPAGETFVPVDGGESGSGSRPSQTGSSSKSPSKQTNGASSTSFGGPSNHGPSNGAGDDGDDNHNRKPGPASPFDASIPSVRSSPRKPDQSSPSKLPMSACPAASSLEVLADLWKRLDEIERDAEVRVFDNEDDGDEGVGIDVESFVRVRRLLRDVGRVVGKVEEEVLEAKGAVKKKIVEASNAIEKSHGERLELEKSIENLREKIRVAEETVSKLEKRTEQLKGGKVGRVGGASVIKIGVLEWREGMTVGDFVLYRFLPVVGLVVMFQVVLLWLNVRRWKAAATRHVYFPIGERLTDVPVHATLLVPENVGRLNWMDLLLEFLEWFWRGGWGLVFGDGGGKGVGVMPI
ncbi:hypothetical protein HDU97_004386 [Phlyctochytrium planicorne]|nr:hypothetical protein HDU97_004386 [Phlyctochytrium planicorne]